MTGIELVLDYLPAILRDKIDQVRASEARWTALKLTN